MDIPEIDYYDLVTECLPFLLRRLEFQHLKERGPAPHSVDRTS